MKSRAYELDMSQGSIFKNVLLFVVPLILGNILQLLYNAADVIVVSRWAGSNAMASVGATGALSALIVNACIGLSIGASVVVSQRYGARDSLGVHRAVHTAILLGFFAGLAAMILGISTSRFLLEIMGTPEGDVLEGAVIYMQIYFLGVPGALLYNFGAAILRSVGDTKRPLYILSTTGIVNVVLNLVFVIKFHMGVAGVAISTSIANYLSAIIVTICLIRSEGVYKLSLRLLRIYKEELKESLAIGLPAGLQSSVFSLSNAVIQSAVNSFGTSAIAGCAAGANIEGFVYTSMNAFHQAAVTAVGQNYGAKNEKRVYHSIITCLICVTVVGMILGFLSFAFARPLLGIYITDSQEAIRYGIIRMTITGLPYFLCGIMDVLTGALRGLGYSSITALNSLIGACGTRLLWVMFVLPLRRSIEVLFICWPVSWLIVIAMHLVYYFAIRKKAIQKMHEC